MVYNEFSEEEIEQLFADAQKNKAKKAPLETPEYTPQPPETTWGMGTEYDKKEQNKLATEFSAPLTDSEQRKAEWYASDEYKKLKMNQDKANYNAAMWDILGGAARYAQAFGAGTGYALTGMSREITEVPYELAMSMTWDKDTKEKLQNSYVEMQQFYRDFGFTEKDLVVDGNVLDNPDLLRDPAFYTQIIGQQAPIALESLLAGGALSINTFGWKARIGAAIGGSFIPSFSEADHTYDKVLEETGSVDKALQAKQLHGLYITGTNAITLDKWLRLNGAPGFLVMAGSEAVGEMSEDWAGSLIESGVKGSYWHQTLLDFKDAVENSGNVAVPTLIYSALMGGLAGVDAFVPASVQQEEQQENLSKFMKEEIKKQKDLQEQARYNGREINIGDVMMDNATSSATRGDGHTPTSEILNKKSKRIKKTKTETEPNPTEEETVNKMTQSITGIKHILGTARDRVSAGTNRAISLMKLGYNFGWVGFHDFGVRRLFSVIDSYTWLSKFDPTLTKDNKAMAENVIRTFLGESNKSNKYTNVTWMNMQKLASKISGKEWNKMTEQERNDTSVKIMKYLEDPQGQADLLTAEQKQVAEEMLANANRYSGVNKGRKMMRLSKRAAQVMKIKGIDNYTTEQIQKAEEYNTMTPTQKNEFIMNDPDAETIEHIANNVLIKQSDLQSIMDAHNVNALFPSRETIGKVNEAIEEDRRTVKKSLDKMYKEGKLGYLPYKQAIRFAKLGQFNELDALIQDDAIRSVEGADESVQYILDHTQKIRANRESVNILYNRTASGKMAKNAATVIAWKSAQHRANAERRIKKYLKQRDIKITNYRNTRDLPLLPMDLKVIADIEADAKVAAKEEEALRKLLLGQPIEYTDDLRYVPRHLTREGKRENFLQRQKSKVNKRGKSSILKRGGSNFQSDLDKIRKEGKNRVYLWGIDDLLPESTRAKADRDVVHNLTLKIVEDAQDANVDNLIGGMLETEGVFISDEQHNKMEENNDFAMYAYTKLQKNDDSPYVAALLKAFPELEGLWIHNGLFSTIQQKAMEIEPSIVEETLKGVLSSINRVGNIGVHLMLMNPLYMYRINTEQQFITAPGAILETFNVIERYYRDPNTYLRDYQLALETFMITGNSPIAERTRSGSYDLVERARTVSESNNKLAEIIARTANPKHANNPALLKVLRASFEMPRSITFDYIDTWQKVAVTNVLRDEAYNKYDNAIEKINKMNIPPEQKQSLKSKWRAKHGNKESYAKEYIMNKSQKYGIVEWMGDYSRVPEIMKQVLNPFFAFYQLRLSTFTAIGKNVSEDFEQTMADINDLGKFLNKREYANMTEEELISELENNNKSQSLKTLGRLGTLIVADNIRYMLQGYALNKFYRWRKKHTKDDVTIYEMLQSNTDLKRVLPKPNDFNNFVSQYRDVEKPLMQYLQRFSNWIDRIDKSGASERQDLLEKFGRLLMSEEAKEMELLFADMNKKGGSKKNLDEVVVGAGEYAVTMGPHTYIGKTLGKGIVGGVLPMDAPINYLRQTWNNARYSDITMFDNGTLETLYGAEQKDNIAKIKAIAKKYFFDYTNFGNIYKLANNPDLTNQQKLEAGMAGAVFEYVKAGKFVGNIMAAYDKHITHPIIYQDITFVKDENGNVTERPENEKEALQLLLYGVVLDSRQGLNEPTMLNAIKDMISVDNEDNGYKASLTDKEINDFIVNARKALNVSSYLDETRIYTQYYNAKYTADKKVKAGEISADDVKSYIINRMKEPIDDFYNKWDLYIDYSHVTTTGARSPYAEAEAVYNYLEKSGYDKNKILKDAKEGKIRVVDGEIVRVDDEYYIPQSQSDENLKNFLDNWEGN